MANRYANLVGAKKISEDFNNINIGFDRVQEEMDANKGVADTHIKNADIHVTVAKKSEWDSKVTATYKVKWILILLIRLRTLPSRSMTS